MPDVLFKDEDTTIRFILRTKPAQDWWQRYVETDMSPTKIVASAKRAYAQAIVESMRRDGLEVVAERSGLAARHRQLKT